MTTLAVINQKGGSGKTTTAVNVAAALALADRRVLLIDLDPQAHATLHLGVDPMSLNSTMYDVLSNDTPLREIVVQAPESSLHVAPSHLVLSGTEADLHRHYAGAMQLRHRISELDASAWDWVIIDCPPTLTLLTVNALIAADQLLIPIAAEYLALAGMAQLTHTLDQVGRQLGHRHSSAAVVTTRFDTRKRLCHDVVEHLRTQQPLPMLKTIIRENVSLSEAPSHGQDIFRYAPTSRGAEDYQELAKELMQ
ncbi:MAG: ParA family protein [Deltaproteobacteria bacterium]